MALPVGRDVNAAQLIKQIESGLLTQVTQDLFKLMHPDLASYDNLGITSEVINSKTIDELAKLEAALSAILPKIAAERLATDSLYRMNARMGSIVRQHNKLNGVDTLSMSARELLKDAGRETVVAVTVRSKDEVTGKDKGFGGIKILAEQHKARMKNAAAPKNHKLKIYYSVENEAEKEIVNSQIKAGVLDKMGIPDTVLIEVVVDNTVTPVSMRASLGEQYKDRDVVVVDVKRDGRTDSDVGALKLIEYSSTVIPALYDAALELLSGNTSEETASIRQVDDKSWYEFIPRISPKDLNEISKEIERYTAVLVAA
jgi:hypothetical protein